MASSKAQESARQGEAIFQDRLRAQLEQAHWGSFVSIEPDSGHYFIGRTFEDAIAAAHLAYPDRMSYTRRIGFSVAVEIG